MKTLITIFEWVFKLCAPVAYFAVSGLSQFLVGVFGLSAGVYSLTSDLGNVTTFLISSFDTATEKVTAFITWISELNYWAIGYELFALDVFGSLFSSFLTFVSFCIMFIFFQAVFQSVFVLVPFLIWKVTAKIISLLSMGYVKTS